MRRRRKRARLAAAIGLLLAAAAAAELGLRAWYRRVEAETERWPVLYERLYWASPPWAKAATILVRDPALGAWMRPNVVRRYINLFGPLPDLASVDRLFSAFHPRVPPWAKQRPVWTLRTNSEGMRGGEVPAKAPGAFRIAAVGDSWTVGVNVPEQASYPAVLESLLAARRSDARVEVLNFGRIGASGRYAAETLRRRVWRHEPDLVVLAFGQNDEYRLQGAARDGAGAARRLLERSELLRFAWYLLERRRASIRTALERSASNPWALAENAQEPCGAKGAADSPFADSMAEAVAEADRRGAAVVLVYAAVPHGRHCARQALRAVAARTGAPLVDGAALLESAVKRRHAALERRLGLGRRYPPAPAPPKAGLLLRVLKPGAADGALRVRLAASREGLVWRDLGPLRDHGRDGDERAGDGVHSLLVPLEAGQDAAWLFRDSSADKGWDGVENYFPRRWRVATKEAGALAVAPIAEFGRMTLRSDPFHADADGYALLAGALADVIADALRSRRAKSR